MPATFDNLGISFQYPENWTIDEEDVQKGGCVTVYSPGGGFLSVAIHPPTADPEKLADAAVDAMKAEYPEVEVGVVHETVADRELVGYDFNFYYLDLTNTATIRCMQTDMGAYSIFCQAEDREFDQIKPVFDAIAMSFLHGLPL